jgi:hypothetical protein
MVEGHGGTFVRVRCADDVIHTIIINIFHTLVVAPAFYFLPL